MDGILGANLNQLTGGSANTSIMRTIGAAEGTAQSKAGIRFNLLGANVLKLEEAEMTNRNGSSVNYDGDIVLRLPRAKVGMKNSQGMMSKKSLALVHLKITTLSHKYPLMEV